MKQKIGEELDRLVREKILKPVENSEWATPIVVVPKPGNKIRICGDFKVTLNPALEPRPYPLPTPEDIFHTLNGGQKFSKLDLRQAFLQVPLDEKSRRACTINTHKGLMEYQRMPFGISPAPAIQQQLMDELFVGLEGVCCFVDDITVTGATDQEHLERLNEVLRRIRNFGLRVEPKKCNWMQPEIELLGRIVDAKGIRANPAKVKAITEMPDPANVKELKSFLGMVNYYTKFLPNLSARTSILNQLRKKDATWRWGRAEKEATQWIREQLTSVKALAHYDPKEEVVLATDASNYGLGAVIFHKYKDQSERVIAYASRKLSPAEVNYSQIKKEALGIVYGVEKFNEYLYGRKFTLQTDHQPLLKIFNPKGDLPAIAAKRRHRWAIRLMKYDFNIEYVATNKFGNADGLSRLPHPSEAPSVKTIGYKHCLDLVGRMGSSHD